MNRSGEVKVIVHHKRSQVVMVQIDGVEEWRRIDCRCPVAIGDVLSWDDSGGYLSSVDGLYREDRIGPCRQSSEPERHWTGNRWVQVVI